ncbi:MAG: ribose 5-phosphate isomerase B [Gemmatimonadota bacterium]|jgi:ribose 5-phosphate isomerase B|nr:ribose 5-phosphate isomerase B [Gemmatimonadota bacterium]
MVDVAQPGERIPIASDHAGFELKERLRTALAEMGYTVADIGTHSTASTDYPDYAHPLAQEVSDGQSARGVLLCGTGLGMSYVANRYPGVRAAVAWNPDVAALARKHNDANILVLPARFVSDEDALAILQAWLTTAFEGGRHQGRVEKIERDDSEADASGSTT